MFDLDREIAHWRSLFNEQLTAEDADELESHLRDNIDYLLLTGQPLAQAFRLAAGEMGEQAALIVQFQIFYEEVNKQMEELIRANKDNPEMLEKLFREKPHVFKKSLANVLPALSDAPVLSAWKARLFYQPLPVQKKADLIELGLVITLALLAGVSGWLPHFLGIRGDMKEPTAFYSKNVSFFSLSMIAVYFCYKFKPYLAQIIGVFAALLASLAFINLIPAVTPYHTKLLSDLHLPVFLWLLLSLAYQGNKWLDPAGRIDFLKYSGETFIYCVLLYLGGGVLMAFSVGIFNSIGFNISRFYTENIVAIGLFAVPVIAIYLSATKRELARSLAPLLARIFSPLFLATLIIFLATMFIFRKDPYQDRDFLLVFNAMLFLVLALVFYIISERNIDERKGVFDLINILLIIVAIVIDVIALSAILFRLSRWGFTANRTTLLGENIILFVNLAGLLFLYLRFIFGKTTFATLENFMARYLPVYFFWTGLVAFIFPIIFSFR